MTSMSLSFSASALACRRINSSFWWRACSKRLAISSDWPSRSSSSNFRRISLWSSSVFSCLAVSNCSSRIVISTFCKLDCSFCSIKSSKVACSFSRLAFSSDRRSKSFFSKRWLEVNSVRWSLSSARREESLSKRAWTASLFDLTCSISAVMSVFSCSTSVKRVCSRSFSSEISKADWPANSCSCRFFRLVSSSTRLANCS